jgi:pyruvate dehydrogenase E1 component alpha subunit
LLRDGLLTREGVTEDDLTAIDTRVQYIIEAAIDVARQAPLPGPDDLTTDVFATELR